ncbi:MAG: phosphoribosylformylglycinamidine synthase subunit PurS [Candidatus Omnitrophica bacterium]|nr:phosphoribosylformylglycinamidine synthase subunit PurS [Candidatus Omnitrophota bacterium]MCM8827404.1 phosphoribosylformylglycinamidine synthase subunit PurS [Candidatus Omnitrophota bacterium]
MRLKAEIYISLKNTVADPQGQVIKSALNSLGYPDLEEVRMGKFITLTFNAKDIKEGEIKINEMCYKLLANPIIEDYKFIVKEL